MASTPLQQLADHGQSVWIDYLSRTFVEDGDLAGLVERGRRRRHLQPDDLPGRDRRGRRLRRPDPRGARAPRREPKEIFLALAARRHPRRLRRPAPGLGRGRAARTAGSRSRSTRTSRTTPRRTIAEAKRLHALVDRPNLFIKIPATQEGLPAIEETIAGRHPGQRDADLLARAPPRGRRGLRPRPPAAASTAAATRRTIASVASFFVSRVDTEADKRLDEIGGHDELKGKLAIANAKLAYQTYKEVFSGAAVGGAGGQGRDRRSAACGRRPRPRTPTTAT